MKRLLKQARRCEVLAENSLREVARQEAPCARTGNVLMDERKPPYRLLVHSQVRLLIAIDVKPRYSNPTCNRLLENGSANNLALPFYFARKSYVDR